MRSSIVVGVELYKKKKRKKKKECRAASNKVVDWREPEEEQIGRPQQSYKLPGAGYF